MRHFLSRATWGYRGMKRKLNGGFVVGERRLDESFYIRTRKRARGGGHESASRIERYHGINLAVHSLYSRGSNH
jgi:hypothetical protein